MSRHVTRRRLLAAAGPLLAATAGCLRSAGADGGAADGAGSGDENAGSDGSGEVPMVGNLERLVVTLRPDGPTPQSAVANADTRITVNVTNETDREHVVVQPDSDFPPLRLAPGTTDSQLWELPAEPGTYEFRCRTHEAALTRVEVEPGGVGGGCPSG
jgi:hypothetical protein